MMNFQVAIDGPAGSGKSSVSKIVSKALGFTHIDTGAMYRAVTLEALKRKIDLNDEHAYSFLNELDLRLEHEKIYLNGQDVSKKIRSLEVTRNVSLVSSHKFVREKMIELQKNIALKGCVLMDGRDIGYNVLPTSNIKIFLTASSEKRALRRYMELEEKENVNIKDIQKEIELRDYMDSNRKINPLKKASDAILLDTTDLSIDEVCDCIIKLIKDGMENAKRCNE